MLSFSALTVAHKATRNSHGTAVIVSPTSTQKLSDAISCLYYYVNGITRIMNFSCFVDYIPITRKGLAFALISRHFYTAHLKNYRIFVSTTAGRGPIARESVRWSTSETHQVIGGHIRYIQILEKMLHVGAGGTAHLRAAKRSVLGTHYA
jgi:hypothetical protein